MQQTTKIRERRVQGYLKQPNFNILNKVVAHEDISESKCLNMIIDEWFNNLSPVRKSQYVNSITGKQ